MLKVSLDRGGLYAGMVAVTGGYAQWVGCWGMLRNDEKSVFEPPKSPCLQFVRQIADGVEEVAR